MRDNIDSLNNNQDSMMKSRSSSYSSLLTFAVFFSALTGLMMGFDLSIIAVILNAINDEFALCHAKEFTCFKKEFFVSMIAPGALCGSLIGGFLADYYGRRLSLCISDLLFIIGSLTFWFSHSFTFLLVARCIVGSGVGIGFVICSTYVSEIAPSDRRGRLILCQEIAQCIGVLLTYLLGSVVGDQHWRPLLVSGGLIAIVQLSGIQFLPESPRWLLIQGNIIEAHRIMKMLGIVEMEFMGDTNLSISPDFQSITGESSINREDSSLSENLIKPTKENANANYRLSRTTIGMSPKAMNQTKERFRSAKRTSILKRVSSCKLLLIACGIGIAQNVLCTNAALYFSMDLMWLARICKPYEWGIGLSIIKFIGTVVVYNLVDRVGRRRLLLGGTAGLGIVFAILAFAYSLVPQQDVIPAGMFCSSPEGANLGPSGLAGPYSVIVLLGLFGLLFCWEISWAGLMYVCASEIIPSNARGVGMGLVVSCFWISLFLSQLCFEWSFRIIQIQGTFASLALAAVLVFVFTYLAIPDMTGKPLESITRMLSFEGNRNDEEIGTA